MTRNQHLFYYSHHEFYLPMKPSISPYSLQIVRSLTLCPDVIQPIDEIDQFCTKTNESFQICELLSLKTEKCQWKVGRPEKIKGEKESLIVVVLPRPEIYRWRLWLYENSLPEEKKDDFQSWTQRQSDCSMLNQLIVEPTDNIDIRINRIIEQIRSGQAIILTEDFVEKLLKSEGIQGIERWLSGHVGFHLKLRVPNLDSNVKLSFRLNSTMFNGDQRFYSAIEKENSRWTNEFHQWLNLFS